MSSRFRTLEHVIEDEMFPAVDLALRRGQHIDREQVDWYTFILDAQDHLEPFYRRFGCDLISQNDGYFYLLPSGEQLSRRQLTGGEMLLGQTLALYYLDPATLQSGGIITREQLLARLASLIGDRDLAKVLEPRRRRFDDERVIHETIRRRTGEALRTLGRLGFLERLDEDHLRLRSPVLRFADPVRGLQDLAAALERLIAQGEIVRPNEPASALNAGASDTDEGDDDVATANGDDDPDAANGDGDTDSTDLEITS